MAGGCNLANNAMRPLHLIARCRVFRVRFALRADCGSVDAKKNARLEA